MDEGGANHLMQRTEVGIDTLLILLRKARIRVSKYEHCRDAGHNSAADLLLPRLLEMRHDLLTALKGACSAEHEEDRPSQDLVDETRHLLRVLAPGRQTRSTDALDDSMILIKRHRRRKEAELATRNPQKVKRAVVARRFFRDSATLTLKTD